MAGASQAVSLQGRLTGLGGEDLPTIVIVAHYDAFGVAPVRMYLYQRRGGGHPSSHAAQPSTEAEASLDSSYSQSSSTHSEGPQVLPQVPMKTLQGGGQHEAETELKLEWVS